MLKKAIEEQVLKAHKKYKAITLLGPRQSGKTTLSRALFPDFQYFSLENPDHRKRATDDPRGFIGSIHRNCILDEVQKTPDILSYLQEILDNPTDQRMFILTSSNSLLLSDKISQSLAGRSRLLYITPLTYHEIPSELRPQNIYEAILKGSYPRIYSQELEASEWYGDYLQTYVEKDVRSLLQIENILQFEKFIRIIASRVGQPVNFSSIGSDAGITSPTAQKWLSVLQASFITFQLAPYFNNFGKRLIKAPKIYFFDTGLLCYILRIHTSDQLMHHPLFGSIFENWVISEYMKNYYNAGKEPHLYFWRDQHGHEIDLVIEDNILPDFIEIKSSSTFNDEFCKNLFWMQSIQQAKSSPTKTTNQDHSRENINQSSLQVIYGGPEYFLYKNVQVKPWNAFTR